MKRTTAALAAAVAVAAPLVAAAPAHAYDRDAYQYAAGHMLRSGDLPASLGDFGTHMDFNASRSGKVFLCFIGEKEYSAPGGASSFGASFYEDRKDALGNGLIQTVTQYAGADKAISAYEALQKSIKGCKGTTSQTWTDDDGSTQTSSSLTTNGRVPGVTEVGVESLFVNQNYLTTSTNVQNRYASDTYTVYTLLNDVIISTSYTTGNLENIPTKQRKKVNQVAFTAIDRWLD